MRISDWSSDVFSSDRLQVMDHGKLTDHNGKQVDFRNVILIMTTNAGAADLAKPAIGFAREGRIGEDTDAINRTFRSEERRVGKERVSTCRSGWLPDT